MLSLFLAPWQDFSQRLMNVRTNVFVHEQGISADLEHDEWDEKSEHVLLSVEGVDIGTGRLLPSGYIGRVCVLKENRGFGFGRKIMLALIDRAKEKGMKELSLSSQVQVLKFYQSLGFTVVSDEYMEAGIPHVKMKLKI